VLALSMRAKPETTSLETNRRVRRLRQAPAGKMPQSLPTTTSITGAATAEGEPECSPTTASLEAKIGQAPRGGCVVAPPRGVVLLQRRHRNRPQQWCSCCERLAT
jgi:hypothetical protein